MHELMQDVRYGIRRLARTPRFSIAVIVVLALGIGANTAIFSAVDAAMLRALPFPEAERLVAVHDIHIPNRYASGETFPKGGPDYLDLAATENVFDRLAAYASGGLNLTGGHEPQRVNVGLVTPGLFDMLGAHPRIGRPFIADEGAWDAPDVVVLSEELWRTQFGGDPSIVGRYVELNGARHEVVGVMPASFVFPGKADLWIPLPVPFNPRRMEAFTSVRAEYVIGRLAPGVTVERADERIRSLFEPYRRAGEETVAEAAVTPLQQRLIGRRGTALLVLLGATVLVLLTACANVANLLLTSAAHRQREIALRTMLGATRWRLVRQLLTESVLIALGGALAGLLLAWLSLGLLRTLTPPVLAALAPPQLDARVLGFSLLIAGGTALVFGLWPALSATQSEGTSAIRSSSASTTTGRRGARLRNVLVVSEIALAVVLVIGAGLMLRSFRALLGVDRGMRTDRTATAEVTLPSARYPTTAAQSRFIASVLERLAATPGISAAGAVNNLPLSGGGSTAQRLVPEATSAGEKRVFAFAEYLQVSPGYFAAMGIPVLRGRSLSAQDDSASPVIVLSALAAARLWPDAEPIGQRVRLPGPGQPRTVVGIVADVRSYALDEDMEPQMYLPVSERSQDNVTFVARGESDPSSLLAGMRAAIRSVDPNQAVYNLRAMDDVVAASVAPRRMNTVLIAVFGALAMILAAVGVYGVMAYGVSQRQHEIGIRVALGARRRDVIGLVMRQGIMLCVAGIALGLFGAYWMTGLLKSLLYGVAATDVMTFAIAPMVLFVVAAVAVLLPAARASRVEPMEALRVE
jgi:putative ABC transport system permease protein